MAKPHLRRLHRLKREFGHLDEKDIFKEYHYQRVSAVQSDTDEPQLLFHLFPSGLLEEYLLIDVTDFRSNQVFIPAVCRGEYNPQKLRQHPQIAWDRITGSFENHNGLTSEVTVYDTGLYEVSGNGLLYTISAGYDVEHVISSMDLELTTITALARYINLLQNDYGQQLYGILSGINLTEATIDQHRKVEDMTAFSDPVLTSRLTTINPQNESSPRTQLDPLFRPFYLSKATQISDLYFGEDGEWELADKIPSRID